MKIIFSYFRDLIFKRTSLFVLWLIIGWFTIYPVVRPWGNALSWDVFGYYLYLPATFLWHDPGLKDFSKAEAINKKYENTPTYYQGQFIEREGQPKRYMIKYTMGVAVLESPFFFAAHLLAPSLGYEPDGFSLPYNYAMIAANFFWVIIGMIFMRKVLLHFFSEKLAALLLVILVLGTNYYVTVLLNPGLTHTFEFSLFAIILWLTIRWHEASALRSAFLLGLFIGLAILVRPTDGLIAIVPLLWKVGTWKEFTNKIRTTWKEHKTHLLALAVGCILVGFPQLYYWKKVAGSWFLFSYSNNPGEGFEFLSPYTLEVLFSFRKGWLVYTPVMIFSIIGLLVLWRKQRRIFFPVTVFFLLNLYVVSSWSCWWYAGSFGQRALVESCAVMILPLGFCIRQLAFNGRVLKLAGGTLIGLMIPLSIFQSWQYLAGIIDPGRMTAAYYFHIFGRTTPTGPPDQRLLLVDRSTSDVEIFADSGAYSKKPLFTDSYETKAANLEKQYDDSVKHSGARSFRLDSAWGFSPVFEMPFKEITEKDHAWIKCSFWYYPVSEMDKSKLTLTVCFNRGEDQYYKYFAAEMENRVKDVKLNQWNYYQVYYMTPEVRNINDRLRVGFWLRGKEPVYVDDLKVEAYEREE